ncbi:FAS-associated factor 2 [Ctenocephalides felis]|uniref:FAS-associated factor 2 n=1 Tax=Ctenocephalides felis TaxID=7515 RepID=UPI000E6E54A5|nr:FAS-associated factor 2 [Ctenocephalides felis]
MDIANDNDMGLTTEQTEKVLQFQDLTGIEDISICRDVLHRHQWDLEVAIQEQLNIREGRPSIFATTESRPPAVVNDHSNQRIYTTPASSDPPVGITGYVGYVFNMIVSLFYNTFSSILNTLLSIFRDDSRRIITDPLADVMGFISKYREQYGSQPVFYQGTYAQAVNDAKRELRFLLVYLHSDNHADTALFCRNTLSHEQVSQYISLHTLLWGCNIQSPEGWRVAHSLAVRRYPVCAVVALRDHRMTVVGRIEGATDKDLFLQRLESLLSDNEIYLTQARADRYERSLTQSLRAQQDEAYEQSLRADQEKERLKEQERLKQKSKENEEKQRQQEEEQRKQKIAEEKLNVWQKYQKNHRLMHQKSYLLL